jgi:hypothetical protein
VPLLPFIVALFAIFLLVLSTPVLLLLRYRTGTMRRRARAGPAIANLLSLLLSAAIFAWVAALTNFWVPRAFGYTLLGFCAGTALGLLGLVATRWENNPSALYYTPNRALVLLITLAVAARLIYGFWRIWHAWHHAGPGSSWLASAGVPGSMAVGSTVLAYYVVYNAGVCWKLRRVR